MSHPHTVAGRLSLEEYLASYPPGERHSLEGLASWYGLSVAEVGAVAKDIDARLGTLRIHRQANLSAVAFWADLEAQRRARPAGADCHPPPMR